MIIGHGYVSSFKRRKGQEERRIDALKKRGKRVLRSKTKASDSKERKEQPKTTIAKRDGQRTCRATAAATTSIAAATTPIAMTLKHTLVGYI